jgi:hypothetical protein
MTQHASARRHVLRDVSRLRTLSSLFHFHFRRLRSCSSGPACEVCRICVAAIASRLPTAMQHELTNSSRACPQGNPRIVPLSLPSPSSEARLSRRAPYTFRKLSVSSFSRSLSIRRACVPNIIVLLSTSHIYRHGCLTAQRKSRLLERCRGVKRVPHQHRAALWARSSR